MEVTLMLISFESLVLSKWNLVKYLCAAWKTFLTCFWLNAGDWKLIPGPFMILLKRRHSDIWPFLIADIYHFKCPLFTFSKKKKKNETWNLDIIGYWVLEHVAKLKRTCNLAPVLLIFQKIPENYCPWLYLSIG